MPRRLPAADWRRAALRWSGGAWARGAGKTPWTIAASGLRLECRPAAGGQVGLFPDHAATWGWLDGAVRGLAASLERPPELLSLFGYTGGATLLAARAGARVAHVDASKPAVAWARRNAVASGLEDRPVRWLADDVRTVVRRERRRGHRYDGVILDPPTYGHGSAPWKIEVDLPPLLDDLAGPRRAERPHAGLRWGAARGAVSRASRRRRGRGRAPADRPQRQRPSARRLGPVARALRGLQRWSRGRRRAEQHP